MEHFDLCVIGGGPAGYAAAMRAIDLGLRTVLVERERIGGTGIFNGALMSKTLWELSQRVTSANEVIRERSRQPFRLSWPEISKVLNEAVFERKYLYACHLQLLENSGDRFKHMRGTAHFTGPHTVMVSRSDARTTVHADHFVIATGSRPRSMPDVRVDERRILSSDGIFAINDLPESIVIVGAGVIGCEFATIFSNFGRTRVHMIDRADRILPFEDADVSGTITRELERKGVIIHHGARLERMEAMPHGVEYTISGQDGRNTVTTELALLSVGRVPNTDGLGLEHTGVERDTASGRIVVNDTRTSVPHIHVVGDATGSHMLVNLGELEGRHAVELLCGKAERPISYDNVSTIMFLDPEVAGVGLNEQECVRQGIAHRTARIDYACVARAIAMRRTRGFFKLIVTDDDHMNVLGMRAVGEHASSAIQSVALMMRTGLGVRELADLTHPHPSITEGLQECARMLLGTSIFKSPVFGDKMYLGTWRPGTGTKDGAKVLAA
ncbi:MAG TPA: NAD(P)/FAD-dependent oxidoreductase [Flavobacteriales bacterium]|nr:NAD(P)/FAD-dependent oxidoreductase [Flavobacteriales bacterium]HMU13273.1 NAD(P)/FAD-dependent oxidoreductase [Flavobacteriales bacterium]HNE79675.1 NAD(P)/FAD-dependent oxidoreductase [Flavobacteriales bacterium]HNI03522.1 NAD(P)/FAD-dependent oxidoreductase [Flavobacteriales bacterium]HNK42301.1 NAD(P)/FAD-dependent oxidoreductase [Flavobacteriales bacterium]